MNLDNMIEEKIEIIKNNEKNDLIKLREELIVENRSSLAKVIDPLTEQLETHKRSMELILEQKTLELQKLTEEKTTLLETIDEQSLLLEELNLTIENLHVDYKSKLNEEMELRLLTEDKLIGCNAQLYSYELMREDITLRPYADKLLSCKTKQEVIMRAEAYKEAVKNIKGVKINSGIGISTPEVIKEYLDSFNKVEGAKENKILVEQQILAGIKDD